MTEKPDMNDDDLKSLVAAARNTLASHGDWMIGVKASDLANVVDELLAARVKLRQVRSKAVEYASMEPLDWTVDAQIKCGEAILLALEGDTP